ncbi:MAG: cupin [Bacteroidetes bacterium]|jgi:predicted cupin superfamily sugar epimerase|nr:cupin [Bacteroidota bacterium]
MTAQEIISQLQLHEHPEGGYYTELYRSSGIIDTGDDTFPDGRNYCTSIYYLLESENISHFHKIQSDEIWHHYEGSSLTIHLLTNGGSYRTLKVGKNLSAGHKHQVVVPSDTWFGVTVDDRDSFALCGCTVSPGFDFKDFEMAERKNLLERFPEHEEIIRKLTSS